MSQNNQFNPKTKEEFEEAIRAYRQSKEGFFYDANQRGIQQEARLITDMKGLFKSFHEFEEDITKWDVSNVEKLAAM